MDESSKLHYHEFLVKTTSNWLFAPYFCAEIEKSREAQENAGAHLVSGRG